MNIHYQLKNNLLLYNSSFIYYEAIKPDLIYTIKYWHEKGFDLWEEIYDYHFSHL